MAGRSILERWAADTPIPAIPLCASCKHQKPGPYCAAFDGKIPIEIPCNEFDHRNPHPLDNGLQYEQKDGVAEIMPSTFNLCAYCKHLKLGTKSCKAFPEGMPSDIYYGFQMHITPFEGDGGILFEPREDLADSGREVVAALLEKAHQPKAPIAKKVTVSMPKR